MAWGTPFKAFQLDLTSNRIEQSGLAESVKLLPQCENGRLVRIDEHVVAGKPRIFRTGFGVNTEGFLLNRNSLSWNRLDDLGSSFNIQSFFSFRQQRLDTEMHWYTFPNAPQWYLNPRISLLRENEAQYQVFETGFQLKPTHYYDKPHGQWHFSLGPEYRLANTIQGQGDQAEKTRLLLGGIAVSFETHDFEFYRNTPRAGSLVLFRADLTQESLGSDVSTQRYTLEGQHLLDYRNYQPSWLILGMRYRFATTLTSRSDVNFLKVPANYFAFLGGSSSLRGFSRKSLPNAQTRPFALSSGYLGFEARLNEVLPLNLQPFLLMDFGMLGTDSFTLDPTLYWNPGLGLRWPSPIGNVRFSLARGFIHGGAPEDQEPEKLQLYLSLGEEF